MEKLLTGMFIAWENALSDHGRDAVPIVISGFMTDSITKETLELRFKNSDFMKEELEFCLEEVDKLRANYFNYPMEITIRRWLQKNKKK